MTGISAALQTLNRKLNKSLQQRGVAATAGLCLVKPLRFAWDYFSLSPERRAYREEELEFDRIHGVETRRDFDLGWMASIQSRNWKYGAGYGPAPLQSVLATLDILSIRYQDFVFIDYGSGKGRTILIASHFPFKRVIGVEYSAHLHTIAEQNIRVYKNPEQRCPHIESVCLDAAEYQLPPDPAVLFFYHPFDLPVFSKVVAHLEQSLTETPRQVYVVYFEPRCAELFTQNVFFREILSSRDVPSDLVPTPFAVFESCS